MARIKYYSIRMRSAKTGQHVSGAEGIYEKDDVNKIVRQYTERALTHEKGKADEIRLTVEELKEKARRIPTLHLSTINTRDPEAAQRAALKILSSVGITDRAIEEAFKALTVGLTMRGAILMDIEGVRLEPDLLRGVRVTRMGITKKAAADLSRKLGKHDLNNDTVKEALILASKVQKYRMVLGELCISDDPGYTTGYIATRAHGYIRLPRIKRRGIPYGGRVFFITGGEVKELIKYLQKTPVMINEIMPCSGRLKLKDVLNSSLRKH